MTATRFNEYDWMGFAGATRFADGSEPFIRCWANNIVAVADAEGIFVSYVDSGIEFFLNAKMTPAVAELALNGVNPSNLDHFERIS